MDGKEECHSRFTRVRQAMRDQGLQTLLVHDSGRHNFLRMNYVAYLTDFISVGPETMLVISLDDTPVLYLAPVWDIPRARSGQRHRAQSMGSAARVPRIRAHLDDSVECLRWSASESLSGIA